jgi:hypothetical protein
MKKRLDNSYNTIKTVASPVEAVALRNIESQTEQEKRKLTISGARVIDYLKLKRNSHMDASTFDK